MLNELSQPKESKYCYDFTYTSYLEQSNVWKHKTEWWFPRLGQGENEELIFYSILQDEKVLEIGYTTM